MTTVRRFGPYLSACLLLGAVGGSAGGDPQPERPADTPAAKLPVLVAGNPLPADPADDPLRKLLKVRYNAALTAARDVYDFDHWTNGPCGPDDYDGRYDTYQRLVGAGLEVFDTPAEKIALLAAYLEMARELETLQQTRLEVGRSRPGEFERVRYERLAAEVRLLRAKRAAVAAK